MTSIDVAGIDLDRSMRTLTMLPGDPTVRLDPGQLRRATHTPHGPGTIDITWTPGALHAVVATAGPGGPWLERHAADLCGVNDDASGFQPEHPVVRDLWRRHQGLRMIRTNTVWHDLAWLIVQQRVARNDAARQWQRLVYAYGAAAPGQPDLRTPPDPQVLARLPYHALHSCGIERRRAVNLIAAARAATRLEALADGPFHKAEPALRSVEGIGPWTTAALAGVTWGDADTVPVGDSGIPAMVSWLLVREPKADDARLLELLEPFRPHRNRVVKLAFVAGQRSPRRHYHLANPDIRTL